MPHRLSRLARPASDAALIAGLAALLLLGAALSWGMRAMRIDGRPRRRIP